VLPPRPLSNAAYRQPSGRTISVAHNGSFANEPVDYATARWVSCGDKKRLAAFEKDKQASLALDAEGNLTYLAASEWHLKFVAEQWPGSFFIKPANTTEPG
jgi:peptide subunit release factor RF-3